MTLVTADSPSYTSAPAWSTTTNARSVRLLTQAEVDRLLKWLLDASALGQLMPSKVGALRGMGLSRSRPPPELALDLMTELQLKLIRKVAMTKFLFTKRAAAEFQSDTAERGAVMRGLLEQIVALAKHSETDVGNLMQTDAGQRLVSLNVANLEDGDPDRYASDWDSVVLAAPGGLTDTEDEQRGVLAENPKATSDAQSVELYGAHLKIDLP